MSKKRSFDWRPGIICLVLLAGVFAGINYGITHSTKFEIRHSDEVLQTTTMDGRYVAGSPEIYQVKISKALVWELSRNNTKFWRSVAWFLLLILACFLLMFGNGWVSFGEGGNPNILMFVIAGAALACYIAAFSSASENNWREISPERYQRVKDNPDSLKALFTDRDYIL